jgi:hypothetical protein
LSIPGEPPGRAKKLLSPKCRAFGGGRRGSEYAIIPVEVPVTNNILDVLKEW